jgi:hypothetical protein
VPWNPPTLRSWVVEVVLDLLPIIVEGVSMLDSGYSANNPRIIRSELSDGFDLGSRTEDHDTNTSEL